MQRTLSPLALAPLALVAALALAACNPAPEPAADNVAAPAPAEALPSANETAPPPASDVTPANVLTLEGLGDLRLGQPVPASSGFAERGAQINDGCRTVSSPDFPGVYAMVVGGNVRRITVGQRSDVKLVEGIGAGATERAVRDAFPGFGEEPHKYEDAPAKYLTAPGATATDPGLRFEIGGDGMVSMIHVGLMPELEYVEGCA